LRLPASSLTSCSTARWTSPIRLLSLHDVLPISPIPATPEQRGWSFGAVHRTEPSAPHLNSGCPEAGTPVGRHGFQFSSIRHSEPDRKSTRLNSSHVSISYAVFCLRKITHTD